MTKIDLVRRLGAYYSAKNRPELVRFSRAEYLSLTGRGAPSEAPFAADVRALYAVSYTLKVRCKAVGRDFVMPKLEALWWPDGEKPDGRPVTEAPVAASGSEWAYRLLIRLPFFVHDADVIAAVQAAHAKKRCSEVQKVTLFSMEEGLSVQMLHAGPFAAGTGTLAWMHDFMKQQKLEQNGKHHEIYLSDLRRTSPEKLKTILREPVRRA